MKELNLYLYEGPVTQFNVIIEKNYIAHVSAPSKIMAIKKLQYEYRLKNRLAFDAKIELPGVLNIVPR